MFQYSNMSEQDISSRYSDSYILADERLFRVTFYDGAFHGYFCDRPASRETVLDPTTTIIDTKSPRLGYCNLGNQAYFLSRIPTRYYRQGIHRRTIRQFVPVIGSQIDIQDVLSGENAISVQETIKGNFPTLAECIKFCTNIVNPRSKAFSRECAIIGYDRQICVFFEYTNVGRVVDKSIELDENFLFLGEYFDEFK